MLLLDNDITHKCVAGDVFPDVVAAVGGQLADCQVLDSFKQQLRKPSSRFYRAIGADLAAKTLAVIETFALVPEGPARWMDLMRDVPNIDTGEARLLANAAETGACILATGDKRALRAIVPLSELCLALKGKVIVLERALLVLCETKGVEAIRPLGKAGGSS